MTTLLEKAPSLNTQRRDTDQRFRAPRRRASHLSRASVRQASVPALYGAVDLGPLPPYRSTTFPTGMNDRGQVVGYSETPGFPGLEAVVWTEGGTNGPPENPQLRGIGNFNGDDYWHSSRAYAINNHGQIVGQANGTGILLDPWHAFVWQDGTMTDLGTLEPYGWGSSMARSITDSGLVAGVSQTQPGDSLSGNPHAFVSDLSNRHLYDIGVDESWANSVNMWAQVVGAYVAPNAEKRAMYWDPYLGAIDLHQYVTAGGAMSEAAAISDSGFIVGWTSDAQGTSRGFCLDLNTGRLRHVDSQGESFAYDVNNAGIAVGSFQYVRPSLYGHAMVWDTVAGIKYEIHDLIENPSTWGLRTAWSINDAGYIAGSGSHEVEGYWRQTSFRLTPRGVR
jgi:probable HAF family extracellular repeat protein